MTVSPQSEVLGLSFYTYPSLKDERTTGRQFSESGIWDCKVRETHNQRSLASMKYDLQCPSSLFPDLHASGCWCHDRILGFHLFWISQRRIHILASQVTFGKFEEEAGECAQLKATTLSSSIYMPRYFLPSWDQQRKHPSSISISWQLPPGAFDVKVMFHPGLQTLL